ncbi:MAG: ester cyclase, partial [Terriglobales bacterium]
PEALAQKYVELWNTGNFDLIDSIFQFPAFMTSRGRRARLDRSMLRRVITAWRTSMPDLNFKIDDTIVQGNRVAMRLAFTGSYKQRLFPNTADPKDHPTALRATAMWMLEVRDGKIRQMWEEYDEIGMHYLMGGRWRSNEELEAAAKADAAKSQPAPESETVPQSAPTPESAASPTPPPKL